MADKTIIFSGYISGEPARKKVKYLERLDSLLGAKGYRLLLVNLGRGIPDTVCDYLNTPNASSDMLASDGPYMIQPGDIPRQMLQAAEVEAETSQVSLADASQKILLYTDYMMNLFREKNPCLCLMWHEFNGRHYTLRYICRKLGIPYLYLEYGVLPGTINIDEKGQMAESWVSRRYKRFRHLPVSEKDLELAKQYLDFLHSSRISRKPQDSKISIEPIVKKAREQGRKIVFYAGQNDWGSGMLPPWLPNTKLHSPCYRDTIDALMHLQELAQQNDWHVLFKPHPLVEHRHKNLPANPLHHVDLVPGANIFDCIEKSDVIVTILSGISYIAMVHQRTVVLLGRTHLYKKGCAYEVFSRQKLEQIMKAALQHGFTPDHQRKWFIHVAQLLKYYLYSIEETTAQIIGRDVNEVFDYLIKQVKVRKSVKFKKIVYMLKEAKHE